MKPLSEKTYVEQAMKNGKGCTWIDDCRIPYQNRKDYENTCFGKQADFKNSKISMMNKNNFNNSDVGCFNTNVYSSELGRFPANLLVEDDVLNDGNDRKSGDLNPSHIITTGIHQFSDEKTHSQSPYKFYGGDSGSFSRYFSLDSWWDEKVKKLPPEVQKVFPFLIVPKASKREKEEGIQGLQDKPMDFDSQTRTNKETADKYGAERKSVGKNHHPTVKPIKLMSYLVTLGSRPNETVLDPFMGSGTTGVACKMLGRKFIGVEMEEEYMKIAEARINAFKTQQKLDNEVEKL